MSGEEILVANELAGAAAEKASVTSVAGASLEALKQNIGPAVVPALTIAGIAYITYLGIKAIVTGRNPLKSNG
ncbi:hypothetical protein KKC44_05165 [Patescibacteria group bacterium]|nr:hypothetical protein [Patescibacteria group bacterium]